MDNLSLLFVLLYFFFLQYEETNVFDQILKN